MKITDEMINRYAEKYCNKYGAIKLIITSEEVAYHFFREQETEDILNYVNSRKPLDEVYLTQAMIECADRAGFVEEWMNTFDPDDQLWHLISRTLRKQIREQKQAISQ
ncbi:MAG: hypothetical protein IK134_08995 [Oscillospiraceae bacterium]|nr:hypothetical protein [Oscillospiraceae bacterium]